MSLLESGGLAGDIWSSGVFSYESPLKDLLDSGVYTLEQLLAEDELLQEIRGLHPPLIEFFSTERAVTGLVQYITQPTPKSTLVSTSPVNGTANAEEFPEVPPTPSNGAKEGTATDNATKDESSATTATTDSAQKEPGAWLLPELEVSQRVEPQRSVEEEWELRFVRYPYMSCEVICCEVNGVVDILADGYESQVAKDQSDSSQPQAVSLTQESQEQSQRRRRLLDMLFAVLYDTAPGLLDDYRAGYLEKIFSVLLRKRPQTLSEFVNQGGERGRLALMTAMISHLYSHSIMQIIQRLLLPQSSTKHGKTAAEEDDDLFADPMDDPADTFRCNWGDSTDMLDLLLSSLIHRKSDTNDATTSSEEEEQERLLSLSQHASEVLITIIQNSPVTSSFLEALTTDPALGRIVKAASSLEETNSTWTPHDSPLTCALNVMESLILQLGGYGSAPPTTDSGDDKPPDFRSSKSRSAAANALRLAGADPSHLIDYLPSMLDSLSTLLRHPACETWQSQMQFAKSEPRKILGMSRLRIVRLLESLVLLGNRQVDDLLCQSQCLQICLDLFWEFKWCSMLHQSVANLLVHVFEGANSRGQLQDYFLVKCDLLRRLMDSFADSAMAGTLKGGDVKYGGYVDMKVGIAPGESSGGSNYDSIVSSNDEDAIVVSDDDIESDLEGPIEGAPLPEDALEDASPSCNFLDRVSMEALDPDSRDGSTAGAGNGLLEFGSLAQSTRLGYMGHVIIICQALVHACTKQQQQQQQPQQQSTLSANNGSKESRVDGKSKSHYFRKLDNNKMNGEHLTALRPPRHDDDDYGPRPKGGGGSSVASADPWQPLVLAQLIDSHRLKTRWQEFVTTTLASETAIQSTPLGGPNVAPLTVAAPLESALLPSRPGRPDDDDFLDGPRMPSRAGLLTSQGDVIPMDDNDWDVAASMMAGISLDQAGNNIISNHSSHYHSRKENGPSSVLGSALDKISSQQRSNKYLFDDPLGNNNNADGGFLLEEDDNSSGTSTVTGNEGEEGNSSNNNNMMVSMMALPHRTASSRSTDEEDDDDDDDEDVPVMNLFAGHFTTTDTNDDMIRISAIHKSKSSSLSPPPMFADFANFDDAFASIVATTEKSSELNLPQASSNRAEEEPSVFQSSLSSLSAFHMEDLFGLEKDHANLLMEEDPAERDIDKNSDNKDNNATTATATEPTSTTTTTTPTQPKSKDDDCSSSSEEGE